MRRANAGFVCRRAMAHAMRDRIMVEHFYKRYAKFLLDVILPENPLFFYVYSSGGGGGLTYFSSFLFG